MSCITSKKNTIPGDKLARMPSDLRMGQPALTSRGFVEDDFEKLAHFFDQALAFTVKLKNTKEGMKLKVFR